MPIIVDASVAAGWALPNEDTAFVRKVLDYACDNTMHQPFIWWYEIRNILIVNERRKRLTQAESEMFLRQIKALPLMFEQPGADDMVMALSRQYGLSIYDAAYLELALRTGYPLASLDRSLLTAAAEAGVTIF